MMGRAKETIIAFGAVLLGACGGESAKSVVVADTTDAATEPAPTSSASEIPPNQPPPPPVDAGTDTSAPPDAGPPLDVPQSLIDALGGKTYVEDSCQPTTYPGWPFAAEKCTYRTNLVVTIANPMPDRVARWIVDASTLIPALDGLHARDRASWEAGLIVIAKHTIGQSSRIFPLDGQIWEDGTTYKFERGVTKTCSSGCYCRVNSTSRQQWCAYASTVLGTENQSTCLSKYGQTTSTLTEPWLEHCFENHKAAWNSDRNDHFRAQAWSANQALSAKFPTPQTAAASAVITALQAEY
jgi:hypothetical protein